MIQGLKDATKAMALLESLNTDHDGKISDLEFENVSASFAELLMPELAYQ
jgi:hypothetical protein